MKHVALALAILMTVSAIGQTTSKRVEIIKRYENGELVQYDSIVKEGDEAREDLDLGKNFSDAFGGFDFGSAFKDMDF